MALEIRVYDEVTDIDPKVLWGLTFRQLIAIGLIVGLGGLAATGLFLAGRHNDVATAIIVIAFPVAAWAWVKPSGLRLEAWVPHVAKVMSGPRRLLYVNEVMLKHQQEFCEPGRDHVYRKKETTGWPEAGQ